MSVCVYENSHRQGCVCVCVLAQSFAVVFSHGIGQVVLDEWILNNFVRLSLKIICAKSGEDRRRFVAAEKKLSLGLNPIWRPHTFG